MEVPGGSLVTGNDIVYVYARSYNNNKTYLIVKYFIILSCPFSNRSHSSFMRGRGDARADCLYYIPTLLLYNNMYGGKRAIIIIYGSIFNRLLAICTHILHAPLVVTRLGITLSYSCRAIK